MPSLMPAGLADQLATRTEFLDLAKFVSVLGKPGPYANDESPVIRKWAVASSESAKIPTLEESWKTAYSLVNGNLPDHELGNLKMAFARGFVEVRASGPIQLKLNGTQGLRLWLDDKEIEDLSSAFVLRPGTRRFTFSIDREARKSKGLRVELTPAPASEARFQPKGGT